MFKSALKCLILNLIHNKISIHSIINNTYNKYIVYIAIYGVVK